MIKNIEDVIMISEAKFIFTPANDNFNHIVTDSSQEEPKVLAEHEDEQSYSSEEKI